jgi:hypothetical protein
VISPRRPTNFRDRRGKVVDQRNSATAKQVDYSNSPPKARKVSGGTMHSENIPRKQQRQDSLDPPSSMATNASRTTPKKSRNSPDYSQNKRITESLNDQSNGDEDAPLSDSELIGNTDHSTNETIIPKPTATNPQLNLGIFKGAGVVSTNIFQYAHKLSFYIHFITENLFG